MQEIERKFLVDLQKWKPAGTGEKIVQGYISNQKERVVRVRISGERAFLTIKGNLQGLKRTELEYAIPVNEAQMLLNLCVGHKIEKTRYFEIVNKNTWEIDVFEGVNRGLVLAEIELEDENQSIAFPGWIGSEVSFDSSYYNARLSEHPYTEW